MFVLFICCKDLEHGSGSLEESEGRIVVQVEEVGGEREVGESGEDRGTRLRTNTVSNSLV